MKKKLVFCLLCGMMLSTVGCGGSKENTRTETEVLEDGTTVEHDHSGDTYRIETLPRNIVYDNTNFTLEKILFYEDSAGEFGYNLWAIAFFDMSSMTEEDYYWFKVNEPFKYDMINVSSEQNNFDFESLSLESRSYFEGDKKLVCAYSLYNYRYSMAGETFHYSFNIYQSETYPFTNDEGEEKDLQKTDRYYYQSKEIPSELGTAADLKNEYSGIFDAIFSD